MNRQQHKKVFTVVIIKSKCLRRRKNLTRRRSLAHARLALTATGEFERFEVRLIDVAGDVVAVKARRVKTRNLSVHAQARLQQIFDSLVNQTIRAESGADFFLRLSVRDKFLSRRHVDAVHVG